MPPAKRICSISGCSLILDPRNTTGLCRSHQSRSQSREHMQQVRAASNVRPQLEELQEQVATLQKIVLGLLEGKRK